MAEDPNRPDADGRTPLHHAVARRDAAAVKALLERGADYERNDNAGYPPTHAMFVESLSGGRWIELTLKKGYKPIYDVFVEFLHNPKCKGTLTFINQQMLYNGIVERSLARVKDALTEGGVWNLDIRLADGTTPLHLAAKLGEARIVQELLANEANPVARDHAGHTPRDLAVANGHATVAALLDGSPTRAPKRKRTRPAAKTAIGKLEDTIVSEVVDAINSVYALEAYATPLDSILLLGDEVTCSAVFLNVPGLRDMELIVASGGRRVEGRFISEDDAMELETRSGLDIRYGARLLMYRVAARLEHDRDLWTVPTTGAIYAVHVDHSMNDINAEWRHLAKDLVAKPIETYLRAIEGDRTKRPGPAKPKKPPVTTRKPAKKTKKRR